MLTAITANGKFDTNGSYCAVGRSGNYLKLSLNQTLCALNSFFPLKYLVIEYIAIKRRNSNSFFVIPLGCHRFKV